jgi:hypothetical protein
MEYIHDPNRWITVPTKDVEQYQNEIMNLYKYTPRATLVSETDTWDSLVKGTLCTTYLLQDTNTNKLLGVIMYKHTKFGNKITMIACQQHGILKTYIIPRLIELLMTPGFYAVLRTTLVSYMHKYNIDNIKDEKTIRMVLEDDKSKLTIIHIKSNGTPDILMPSDPVEQKQFKQMYRGVKEGSISIPRYENGRQVSAGLHVLYGRPCFPNVMKFEGEGCQRKCVPNILPSMEGSIQLLSNRRNLQRRLQQRGGRKNKTMKKSNKLYRTYRKNRH